ncbi:replication protein A 70 kDa DNA-binding subunit, partial [Trifolium pratense]
RGNKIHCTLWDDFAMRMQQYLDSHDSSMSVVIILQLCKFKKYLGALGISNSFYGSKLLLNAQFSEVTDYIERMNVANVELTQVVSQMTGPSVISVADDLLQSQRMTIEDLIESIELAADVHQGLVLLEVNSIVVNARCQELRFLGSKFIFKS